MSPIASNLKVNLSDLSLGLNSGISDMTGEDLSELEALLDMEEAERGLNDLYYFDKYILGYSDMEPRTHLPVCHFIDSESKRKHLELPRGCFKSSVVTIGHTVREVAKNPDIRILIDNEVYGNSKAFLREVKAHMENPDVVRLYPQLTPNKRENDGWTESTVIVQARSKAFKEPTISCAGLDQIKVGMHYDLILMDDLVSSRNVTTREQIDKVIDHYKLALSLLEPEGTLIVVGTRYLYGDLYGYLLKNEADTFDHLIIPAVLKADIADELNTRFPDIVQKYGSYAANSLLFPERLTEEFLKAQRRAQGTYIFNCQYMLNPVDSDTADFRREWLRYAKWYVGTNPDDGSDTITVEWMGDHKKNLLEDVELPVTYKIDKVITVDPNNKKKRTSDSTGGVVVAVSENNDWFILDLERDILNPGQIARKVMDMQKRYKPKLFGLEEVGKDAIQYLLKQEMRDRNTFFGITELKPGGVAKEDRIKRLIPRFEFGTIFLPTTLVKKNSYGVVSDLVEVLEDELMYFPAGEHDDLIDALAYVTDLVELLRRRNTAKTRKKGKAKKMGPRSNLPRNRRPAMVDVVREEDHFV